MSTIIGVVRDGLIVPREPVDWPDGTEVEVTLRSADSLPELQGMTEEEQGDSPEAIARWIAAMEAIPTPTMTEKEWAAMEEDDRRPRFWTLHRKLEGRACCPRFSLLYFTRPAVIRPRIPGN